MLGLRLRFATYLSVRAKSLNTIMLTNNQRFVVEPLSEPLESYLASAQSVISKSIIAYPCEASLTDGTAIDTFIISESEFRKYFKIGPTSLEKHEVSENLLTSHDVLKVKASNILCQKELIEDIYKIKNSSKLQGYGSLLSFRIIFNDNSSQAFYSEFPDLIDFLSLPQGKSYKDVHSIQKTNSGSIKGIKDHKPVDINKFIVFKGS